MGNWVCIYSDSKMHRAEMIKHLLSEYEIPSVILNKKDSSYNDFGDLEIHVDRDHVIRALSIIEKHQF